jgi:uncharacterized protein (TIGR02246 family)
MSASSPEALSAAFAHAINARDVEAALELWIEDAAILRPDGQTVRGLDAIATALHALVDNGANVKVEVSQLFSAGDVALATGTLTLSGSDAHGNPYTQQSRSVVIYCRGQDDRWRLGHRRPLGPAEPLAKRSRTPASAVSRSTT